MSKKLTVADLFEGKGKTQRTQIFTMKPEEAAAAEAAGIEMIVTPGRFVREIRKAAPKTFLTGGLVGDHAINETTALTAAYEVMNAGGDAVYTSANLLRVEDMAREHIPVVGHVGYVPYRKTWYGRARAVGKTIEEARVIYEDTIRYEEAGAIGVEMEIVPHQIATAISERTSILVISMGAGSGGDAQYLFAEDILGTNQNHVPRHAKVYADLHTELQRIQQLREKAFAAFKQDVSDGTYPAQEHLIVGDEDVATQFVEELDSMR